MTTTNSNLDLSKISNEDHEQLAQKIEGYYKADGNAKTSLAWNWERTQLMLDGKQWLVYDGDRRTGGQWTQLKVHSLNEYIPRPVTNYLFDSYQTLKSYLLKNRPRSTVRPNTQEYKDKIASKIANLILECNWERFGESQNYEAAAANLITYGTVFKKSYWDTSTLSMSKIPRMIQQPTTDPATGQITGYTEVLERDPATGDIQYDYMPLGDVATAIIEPYRMAIDPLATSLFDASWVMEYSIQRLSWVIETYGREGEGFTGAAVELQEETSLSGPMRRFLNLKTSSGQKSEGSLATASNGGNGDDMIENAVVVKEYYERPTQNYPKGRLVVVANGKTLYAGESPYSGDSKDAWHPYSECRWETMAGRFWGKGPLDDAIEPQKRINSIDSVIILTRKTMAIPQKSVPIGLGIKPGQWTGRPGQEIFWKPDGTGSRPETIPAASVAESVFAEREQKVQDIKNITGAIDILKGDRPPGVNAASALNLLYEVGTGKLYPVLNRWKDFVENDQKKQLRLVSQFYREPREEFIRLLKSKNTELSEEQISRFIGSDLYDNCNVIVEAGSNVPKLQAARQAMLMELAQVGVLNLDVPENKMKFLEAMGVFDFANEISGDVKRAEWENDLMDNLLSDPDSSQAVIVLEVDDDATHKEVHKRRMKQPSFMSLPFEIQQKYMQHLAEHSEMEAKKAQQQMIESQLTGAPPPMPGEGANQPQQLSSAGKGLPAGLKKGIMGGDLPPGATE